MFKRLAFISKLFFFLLFHKASRSPQHIPLPSCKSQWSNFTACPHLSYCSTPALQPSTILLNGDMQKSQPLLSSSPSRALSLIILSLGYATCIHSVPGNISLAVCSALTELLTSTCINHILLSSSSPESFPYHALPAAQMHTSPTDMWSVTHNSSQHLSCFPKPKSKSSDQVCHRIQTQSTLKIKFYDRALFAEGNFSLATSEHSRISRQSKCYKNDSVVSVHPTASALLPWKCFS